MKTTVDPKKVQQTKILPDRKLVDSGEDGSEVGVDSDADGSLVIKW